MTHEAKMAITICTMTAGAMGVIGYLGFGGTAKAATPQTFVGTLKIDGSSTVYPAAKREAEEFTKLHPGVKIDVKFCSSGEGLKKFIAGDTNISDSSRPPKTKEFEDGKSKGKDLHLTTIADDALSVIVHPSNSVKNLSLDQLKGIFFTHTITDWAQVTSGQKHGSINVYVMDGKKAGAPELFDGKVAKVKDAKYVAGAHVVYPDPAMIPALKNDPNGIGYVSLKLTTPDVKSITVNEVAPSPETVLDASYPLCRKLFMVTNGTPTGLEREFISFIFSKKGQSVVQEVGFIPVALR